MAGSTTPCPNGHSNPVGQAFCGQCGAAVPRVRNYPLGESWVCANNHYNDAVRITCKKCKVARDAGSVPTQSGAMPSSTSRPKMTSVSGGLSIKTMMIVVGGTLSLVLVGSAMAGGCQKSGGNSESYKWGTMAGNSAVTLVNNGVPLEQACDAQISVASMGADSPITNQTPPPKNFNLSEAKQGCMDQLHRKLGY